MKAFLASLAACAVIAGVAAGILAFLEEDYGREMRFGDNVSVESGG